LISFFRLTLFLALITVTFFAAIEAHPPKNKIPHLDKFIHFFVFFVLSWIVDSAIKEPLYKNRTLIACLFLYSIGIEIMQFFIPYRHAEFYDVIANLIGMLVYLAFIPRLKK